MDVRRPTVAGQFYAGGRNSCIAEIKQCLEEAKTDVSPPEEIVGGIVPHAGWAFSGSLAAMVFEAVGRRHTNVDTFIILGAVHSHISGLPAVWTKGAWETPLGEIEIDEDLALEVVATGAVESNRSAHIAEHSIEVQIPFVQYLFPIAKILPIVVPPDENAIALGACLGDLIVTSHRKIVCIGSTDLTHYGPRYGFTPKGIGEQANRWANDVNDREFIDAALELNARRILDGAVENYNACGAGAAAAVVEVAGKLGKKNGVLLGQTSSSEVISRRVGTTSQDSVGYAAIVF